MKNKNILFVSIFDLTKVFHGISDILGDNYECYWITTNEVWTNYLVEKGVSREKILELIYSSSDFLESSEKEALLARLLEDELKSDISVFQSVLMDRFLTYSNRSDLAEYVFLYYRDMVRWIENNDIHLVFGEPTAFNELLLYTICKARGVIFTSPNHMRYPSDRVVFTIGYLKERLVELKNIEDREQGKEYLEKFKANRKPPSYFTINNNTKTLDLSRILKSVANRIRQRSKGPTNHLTHHPLKERIAYNFRKLANSFILLKVHSYPKIEEIKTRKAFYGIHVQPENSIDVIASYFSDQLKLIKDIRRALPFDYTLIIKEHPNKLGAKPMRFYKEIRKIPGVTVLHPLASAFEILEVSDLVFTVSGTIAYEAGLLGKPAIMFSPLYFNKLSTIIYCENISDLRFAIQSAMTLEQNVEADKKVLEDLFENSHEGYWTDPYTDPNVLEESNIKMLSKAFRKVIEQC